MKTTMRTYKLRAECRVDVDRLALVLAATGYDVSNWKMTPNPDLPDVTLVFDSSATVEELRAACTHVPDGHVMEQTVEPIALYTGERTRRQRKTA